MKITEKQIQKEINVLFPEKWGDERIRKQRYAYTHLRMRGVSAKEALAMMQEQNLYP